MKNKIISKNNIRKMLPYKFIMFLKANKCFIKYLNNLYKCQNNYRLEIRDRFFRDRLLMYNDNNYNTLFPSIIDILIWKETPEGWNYWRSLEKKLLNNYYSI